MSFSKIINSLISPLRLHSASSVQSPFSTGGRSGGAKVLGKLPVPGRPTNLD